MFRQLRDFGAELVFFMDGPTPADKREVWLERQNERYDHGIRKVFYKNDNLSVARIQRNIRGGRDIGTVLLSGDRL